MLFGGEPINFLSDPKYFPSIIVWSDQWTGLGWGTIIYLSALSSIDQQLYESARIDGCGRFRQALHVTIPGIIPTIAMLMILNINVLAVNSEKILLLYTPLTYETGDVFGTFIYRQGIGNLDYSFSTALELFRNLISLVLVVSTNKICKLIGEYGLW